MAVLRDCENSLSLFLQYVDLPRVVQVVVYQSVEHQLERKVRPWGSPSARELVSKYQPKDIDWHEYFEDTTGIRKRQRRPHERLLDENKLDEMLGHIRLSRL